MQRRSSSPITIPPAASSKEDLELTRSLTEILNLIDVRVLDHLIVGEEVLSLSETGHHNA